MIKINEILKEEETVKINYYAAFNKFIKGKKAVFIGFREPQYPDFIGGTEIEFSNGYKITSGGGGASGNDVNTSWILDNKGNIIAKDEN